MDSNRPSRGTGAQSRLRDAAVLLPLLGLFAWMPPIIGLFASAGRVFGIPLIVVWLFGIWLLLIGFALWFSRLLRPIDDVDPQPEAESPERPDPDALPGAH